MSISLIVQTPGPPERLRALLSVCRPVVDEIVVLADASGDPATLDAVSDLADRRLRASCSSQSVALGWHMRQCRGDWIMRMDSDEIPSAAMLEALPALAARRGPASIAFRRRWLHPDGGSFIATRPWLPDFQVRLIRNLPGLWSFPGLLHQALVVTGERHFAAEALYHADLLLSDLSARRAKRDRYAPMRPGLLADGIPINDFYVPEEHDVRTTPVPVPDTALVAQLLEPAPVPPGLDALAPVEEIPLAAIERHWGGRTVDPGACRAAVRYAEPVGPYDAGSEVVAEIEVDNRGDAWWPAGDVAPRISLGLRWLADGVLVAEDRALFTETVAPGETTRLQAGLRIPATPGTYVLEADVVHEDVRWFGAAARAEVVVRRR